jgi:hypothetical protein
VTYRQAEIVESIDERAESMKNLSNAAQSAQIAVFSLRKHEISIE